MVDKFFHKFSDAYVCRSKEYKQEKKREVCIMELKL